MAAALKAQGHEIRFILRRGGELADDYRKLAETFVWREDSEFGLLDALDTVARYDPVMAVKCLRNPDRPYCMSRPGLQRAESLVAGLRAWVPDFIYVNTTHCGDVLDTIDLAAPIITHVREMTPTISALDKRRRACALNKTDLFLCASTSVRDNLANDFAIPASRMRVEPPAIELAPAQAVVANSSRDAVEKHLGLAPQDRLILGAGSLIPRKGPDLFVDAAIIALESYCDAGRLVFAWLGEGPMLAELDQRIQATGHQASILLLGLVSDPFPYYQRASALLVTSREDPYPRVAIEAAAFGVPVAAYTHSGGAADLVRNYDAGQLVEGFSAAAMASSLPKLVTTRPAPDSGLAARVRAGHTPAASAERLISDAEALARRAGTVKR